MDAAITGLLENGALNLAVSLSFSFLYYFIHYHFMRKLLPNRLNNSALIPICLIYALWYNLRASGLLGTDFHIYMNIFVNTLTVFILIFLFKGKFWRRVIAAWYFDSLISLYEAAAFVPAMLYHALRGYQGGIAEIISLTESDAAYRLVFMLVFVPLYLLLGSLSVKIWRGISLKKFLPFYLLFILLPMGQLYSLAHVIHPNMGDLFFGLTLRFVPDAETAYSILAVFGIFVCVIADAAILYFVVSLKKRAAIEAELRKAKREMELEQARFEEVEKRSEELAKIRHDMNNQLMSVIQLVRSGESAAANEVIDALTGELNRAAED